MRSYFIQYMYMSVFTSTEKFIYGAAFTIFDYETSFEKLHN